ncbi:hypothetical protein [Rouxiella badensis]|uniref:hypothetical protein n=1 Tax=Rouxiella badensis TaxID=1646377 RepID=UPI00301DA172
MPKANILLNVELHVAPKFSGRLLLHFEHGRLLSDRHVLENELVGSVELFKQLLQRAGYRVEANCEE